MADVQDLEVGHLNPSDVLLQSNAGPVPDGDAAHQNTFFSVCIKTFEDLCRILFSDCQRKKWCCCAFSNFVLVFNHFVAIRCNYV